MHDSRWDSTCKNRASREINRKGKIIVSIIPNETTGPLAGYKILDFTRAYAGPFATMMLADLGATVIKVEGLDGDPNRQLGPYLHDEDKDMGIGGFNLSVCRGKKSIALNLKDPLGQKVAKELVKECDAMILNFSTPKIMTKFDLDYETVKEINPKMVYVSISGYGTNKVVPSDYEGKPTIDMMMQAESGCLSITGSPDGEMYKVGPGIGDSFTGTVAIVAMLSAMLHAKDTGKGQFIDIAMLDSMIMLSERILFTYSYTGVSPGPIGNRHPLQAPYSVYKTSDGAVALAGFPEKYWDRFVEACGVEELKNKELFGDKTKRLRNIDLMDSYINSWMGVRSKKEVMELLNEKGCLAAPVNRAEDLFNDEHIRKREMIVEVEGHPKTHEKASIVGTPFKFSDTKAQVYGRSPMIGENSIEITKQLGFDDEFINNLIERGVMGVSKI